MAASSRGGINTGASSLNSVGVYNNSRALSPFILKLGNTIGVKTTMLCGICHCLSPSIYENDYVESKKVAEKERDTHFNSTDVTKKTDDSVDDNDEICFNKQQTQKDEYHELDLVNEYSNIPIDYRDANYQECGQQQSQQDELQESDAPRVFYRSYEHQNRTSGSEASDYYATKEIDDDSMDDANRKPEVKDDLNCLKKHEEDYQIQPTGDEWFHDDNDSAISTLSEITHNLRARHPSFDGTHSLNSESAVLLEVDQELLTLGGCQQHPQQSPEQHLEKILTKVQYFSSM